jgi:hypothetical protein
VSIARVITVTAALLVAAGSTAACGGEDEAEPAEDAVTEEVADEEAEDEPEDEDGEEQAVVDVIDRFRAAVDADEGEDACALLTGDLQGVYAQNPGASDCPGGISHLHDSLDGAEMSAMEIAAEDVKLDGEDAAVVSYELIAERNGFDPDDTDSYNMEREDGEWKISYIG